MHIKWNGCQTHFYRSYVYIKYLVYVMRLIVEEEEDILKVYLKSHRHTESLFHNVPDYMLFQDFYS